LAGSLSQKEIVSSFGKPPPLVDAELGPNLSPEVGLAEAIRWEAVAGERGRAMLRLTHKHFQTSAVRRGSAASLHWNFFMGVSCLMLDIFRLLSLLLVLELR
jgi:hypothetical protein